MAFTVPTLDEMAAVLVAFAKMLFPDLDVSRTSTPALLAKVIAAGVTDNHSHLKSVQADATPLDAEGEGLADWGTVSGVPRKGATVARKSGALRLTNNDVVDRTVTIGAEMVHKSTLRFAVNETVSVPAGDTLDVAVISIDTGSACKLAAGETLRFVGTAPTGIEEEAELQLDISEGGDDLESEADWKTRILSRFQIPPLGGAQNDYVTWSRQLTGIDAAYAYPIRQGLNTVDVAALHKGSGADRMLNPAERATLLAWIELRRPVGVTVRVLETLAQSTNVEITIKDTGEPAYAWDWIDETPLEVDAWDGPSLKMTFSTDRPDTMVAGGRIIIRDDVGLGDGRQYVIESLDGTDAVILEEHPKGFDGADLDPVSVDLVYSGGHLVDAVRDAIAAHVDEVGTANPDDGPYGAWEGNLRTARLGGISTGVAGVRDATVVAPAANVEAVDPAFPDDDTIYLITRGRLIVRKEW